MRVAGPVAGVVDLGKIGGLVALGILGIGIYALSRRGGAQAIPEAERTFASPLLTQAVEAAKNVGTGERSYVLLPSGQAMGRGKASYLEYRRDVEAGVI